jgi:ribosomal protein S18 acetylase RimI-like enzyme
MNDTHESVGLLINAWKLMVGRLPDGRIHHADGVASCIGHVPLPFFNFSMNDRRLTDAADLRRFFANVDRATASCAHPSMTALCEDWAPADWGQVATDHGLATMMQMTGMETDQLLPPRRPPPALDIRRVSDDAAARHLATVNAHAYAMPPELFECVCNMRLWHDDSLAFVGYVDGRPVTSAAALPVNGTVYIALVATMPDCHGKGYADAVMRHAIAAGQQAMGVTRTTLHATDMGRPVYQAMGYQPSARFAVLMKADAH